MTIELLHHTPLWVAARAIRKCWASEGKSDTTEEILYDLSLGIGVIEAGPADCALIERVGNKNKHASTLEHLNYSFDIDGISRACLQELARHRHTSLSVKSTRYTLKELKEEKPFLEDKPLGDVYGEWDLTRALKYIVVDKEGRTLTSSLKALEELRKLLVEGISNDIAKYSLPESYKTSLVWTINARALQNFLNLRTDKAALWEIRKLAYEIFDKLPGKHKYLFEEFIKTEDKSK